jgi:DNA-binding GntR family transcriptional regulator
MMGKPDGTRFGPTSAKEGAGVSEKPSTGPDGRERSAVDAIWKPPPRNMLADDVYDVIRTGLLANRFVPGERLNLDQIARELGVSNTPVRQALARLESEGLITKEPYRGFRVSTLLDQRSIEELYEYRLFVEPPTAANAARGEAHAAAAGLASLVDPAAIDDDPGSASGHEAMSQRDADFHCSVARIAGNRVVTEALERTYAKTRLYQVYGRSNANLETAQEHQRILDAIVVGDPDAAAAAMREHLMHGFERLRHAFG